MNPAYQVNKERRNTRQDWSPPFSIGSMNRGVPYRVTRGRSRQLTDALLAFGERVVVSGSPSRYTTLTNGVPEETSGEIEHHDRLGGNVGVQSRNPLQMVKTTTTTIGIS